MNIHLADQGSNRYIHPVSAIIKQQIIFFLIIVAFYEGKRVNFSRNYFKINNLYM